MIYGHIKLKAVSIFDLIDPQLEKLRGDFLKVASAQIDGVTPEEWTIVFNKIMTGYSEKIGSIKEDGKFMGIYIPKLVGFEDQLKLIHYFKDQVNIEKIFSLNTEKITGAFNAAVRTWFNAQKVTDSCDLVTSYFGNDLKPLFKKCSDEEFYIADSGVISILDPKPTDEKPQQIYFFCTFGDKNQDYNFVDNNARHVKLASAIYEDLCEVGAIIDSVITEQGYSRAYWALNAFAYDESGNKLMIDYLQKLSLAPKVKILKELYGEGMRTAIAHHPMNGAKLLDDAVLIKPENCYKMGVIQDAVEIIEQQIKLNSQIAESVSRLKTAKIY